MNRTHAILATLIGLIWFVNHTYCSRAFAAQQISATADQIQGKYDEALRNAKGNSDLQIVAELARRNQLLKLAEAHVAKLDSITSETELSSLASAFEAAGVSDKAVLVTKRLLATHPYSSNGHKLSIRHLVNYASGDEALAAMQSAAKAVSTAEMKPLLPYWGVLGFKFANEGNHARSIACFDHYLKSRYQVAKKSAEPLPVLPTILKKVGEQSIRIDDRTGYEVRLKECDKSLADAAAIWQTLLAAQAEQTSSPDNALRWLFHYRIVSIFLAGELQHADPLAAYRKFLRMTIDHREWVSQQDDFQTMLEHANQMAIATSHAWKSQPQDIELADKSTHASEGAKPNDRVGSLVRAAISQVEKHGESVSKLKTFSRGLPVEHLDRQLGGQEAWTLDEAYVLCLARNPSAMVHRLRKQLAELALHHWVVICAVNEDERLVLNRQLQTLPKPMEMADSPFRIHIIQKPVQWGELSQLGDDVNWLVVKNRKVSGQWVGNEEEKISQIRWQLISK